MKGKIDAKDWTVSVPKTRLAFIGAGTHATNMLFPSLNYLDYVERVAVCDLDFERASFVAKRFGLIATLMPIAWMFGGRQGNGPEKAVFVHDQTL